MLNELKRMWSLTPWYFKILLVFLVPLVVLERVLTFATAVKQNIQDNAADEKVAQFKKQEDGAAIQAAQIEGTIQQLESEKAKLKEEKPNDSTEFLNSYHPPTDSK